MTPRAAKNPAPPRGIVGGLMMGVGLGFMLCALAGPARAQGGAPAKPKNVRVINGQEVIEKPDTCTAEAEAKIKAIEDAQRTVRSTVDRARMEAESFENQIRQVEELQEMDDDEKAALTAPLREKAAAARKAVEEHEPKLKQLELDLFQARLLCENQQ